MFERHSINDFHPVMFYKKNNPKDKLKYQDRRYNIYTNPFQHIGMAEIQGNFF